MFRTLFHSGWSLKRRGVNTLVNLFDSPLVILLYHRVCDLSNDPFELAVSPENFYAHLKFLKDNWPIVTLQEALLPRVKPAVAISFDDGYADNLIHALPVLEELEVPATFFVTSGYLGAGQEFWWDMLEKFSPVSGYGSSEQFQLHAVLKRLPPFEREQHMARLHEQYGYSELCRESHRTLTSSELKRLAASNWADIGSHGVSHTAFSTLSEASQLNEMRASRECLQNLLHRDITLFSYPFGGIGDFTRNSVLSCRDAGFTAAFANIPGQVHRWTDSFKLPRNLVRNWPVELFAQQMKRFWTT